MTSNVVVAIVEMVVGLRTPLRRYATSQFLVLNSVAIRGLVIVIRSVTGRHRQGGLTDVVVVTFPVLVVAISRDPAVRVDRIPVPAGTSNAATATSGPTVVLHTSVPTHRVALLVVLGILSLRAVTLRGVSLAHGVLDSAEKVVDVATKTVVATLGE